MENAALGIDYLAVAVVVCCGVKALGKFVLSFGGDFVLVLEDDDVMVIQCVADCCELVVWWVLASELSIVAAPCTDWIDSPGRLPRFLPRNQFVTPVEAGLGARLAGARP